MASRILKSFSPRLHRKQAPSDSGAKGQPAIDDDDFALALGNPCAGKSITDTMPEFKAKYASETEDTSHNLS
jgi:hypothetical protein